MRSIAGSSHAASGLSSRWRTARTSVRDEIASPMKRCTPIWRRAARPHPIDQLRSAREEAVDDALVVLHRGALRDRQRDDSRPLRSESVDPQHPGGDADRRGGILEHRVVLADDAGREFRQDPREAREDALAVVDRNVVRDNGAEGGNVEAAVVADWQEQLEWGDARFGKRRSDLAE